MVGKAGKRRQTGSQRCGLQFPVGRVKKFLKARLGLRQRMSMGAPIYTAAVLEYLSAEVLEISGNVARDQRLKRITPRHVMLAIANDEELTGKMPPAPKKTAKGKTAAKRKPQGITILSEKILSGGQKLTVFSGDLVDVKCDCIAYSDGGQVNARLTTVGGADFQQKIKEAGAEWTKTVGICEAANFACDYVMRCSAPTWSGGNPANAISELDKVIKTCLETADKKKISTIAFPSIGSGGAGFPKQTAVQTILRTMSDYLKSQGKKTNISQIYFVLYDKQSVNVYTAELGRFVE